MCSETLGLRPCPAQMKEDQHDGFKGIDSVRYHQRKNTMKHAIAAAFMSTFWATAALATGSIYCDAPNDSGAGIEFGFGRSPGLAVISATINAADQEWSMGEVNGAIPIVVAQAATFNMYTILDFTDPDHLGIVASVRLIAATEGDEYVTVGTLTVPEVGVFPLVCEGP